MKKRLLDYCLGREREYDCFPSFINLLFRCFCGLMMLPYGYSKITDYDKLSNDFFGDPIGIGNLPSLWLTMFAQLVCSVTLILGFQTRLSAAILAFDMLVATKYHFFDPFITTKTIPLVFLGMYLIALLWGGGRYSVDHRLFSRNMRKRFSSGEVVGMICIIVAFALLWAVCSNAVGVAMSIMLAVVALLLFIMAYNLMCNRIGG